MNVKPFHYSLNRWLLKDRT